MISEWITGARKAISRMLGHTPQPDPVRELIDRQEQRLVARIARASGKSPQQVREAAVRKAELSLRLAVRSRR